MHLRRHQLGVQFRRQHLIGPYIVDFCSVEHMMIVELDGGQHVDQRAQDEARTQWLAGRGFRVLRFSDHEALMETEATDKWVWGYSAFLGMREVLTLGRLRLWNLPRLRQSTRCHSPTRYSTWCRGHLYVVLATGLWLVFVEAKLDTGIPLSLLSVIGLAGTLVERERLKAIDRPMGYAIFVMIVSMSTATICGYDIYDHYGHQPSIVTQSGSPMLFKSWGSPQPQVDCRSTIDGSQLVRWKDKYDLVVVCGITDPTIDKFKDQRITVSPLFTIYGGDISITEAISQDMSNAVKKIIDDAVARIVPKPQKGTVVGVPIPVWYEPALLPKGTDVRDIHRLADVSALNGFILSLGFPK